MWILQESLLFERSGARRCRHQNSQDFVRYSIYSTKDFLRGEQLCLVPLFECGGER